MQPWPQGAPTGSDAASASALLPSCFSAALVWSLEETVLGPPGVGLSEEGGSGLGKDKGP